MIDIDSKIKQLKKKLQELKESSDLSKALAPHLSSAKSSSAVRQLGTTRSGKAIMSNFDHQAHKDFTANDHYDAQQAHMKAHAEARKYKDLGQESGTLEHHEKQAKGHWQAFLRLKSTRLDRI